MCWDSLQVRYIAKELEKSPAKDSLISSQKSSLESKDSLIVVQDSIILNQESIIVNDSLTINNQNQMIDNYKENEVIITDELIRQKSINKWTKRGGVTALLIGLGIAIFK